MTVRDALEQLLDMPVWLGAVVFVGLSFSYGAGESLGSRFSAWAFTPHQRYTERALRMRAAALAVVEAGADDVSPAADGIPQTVWDGLHEDDLIRNWTGDPSGEQHTVITDAGRAELYRLIGVTPS